MQTEVAGPGADRERNKLLRQGFALAKLYALSTLSLSASEKATKVIELVQGGNPLVFVELKSNEAPPRLIPEGFTAIPPDRVDGASLVFGRLGTSAGVVGVWILQRGGPRRALQRSLRLTLMRLHAEQEALDLVLKQISRHRVLRPPSSRVVNDLNDYFNDKTKLINRDEWGGIDQSAIREAFDASEHVTTPATRQNLVDRYEGTRRQVWEKIEEYQIRRSAKRHVTVVNVGKGALTMTKIVQNAPGIINVAEFMSQVTNQINNNLENSSSSDEVKALIKQLTDQVSAISPKIDPEQTKRMGGDLNGTATLT